MTPATVLASTTAAQSAAESLERILNGAADQLADLARDGLAAAVQRLKDEAALFRERLTDVRAEAAAVLADVLGFSEAFQGALEDEAPAPAPLLGVPAAAELPDADEAGSCAGCGRCVPPGDFLCDECHAETDSPAMASAAQVTAPPAPVEAPRKVPARVAAHCPECLSEHEPYADYLARGEARCAVCSPDSADGAPTLQAGPPPSAPSAPDRPSPLVAVHCPRCHAVDAVPEGRVGALHCGDCTLVAGLAVPLVAGQPPELPRVSARERACLERVREGARAGKLSDRMQAKGLIEMENGAWALTDLGRAVLAREE